MWSDDVDLVCSRAREAEPRCGRTVVVGIDGPSGSGKTTLAFDVRSGLGCPLVHMDDLYPGWDGLGAAPGLLADLVLRPLSRSEPVEYLRWDWRVGRWGEPVRFPWTPLLIVEGCASTVQPAGDMVAVRVWLDAEVAVRKARGLARDGAAFAPHWQRWAAQESALFAADGTPQRADLTLGTR